MGDVKKDRVLKWVLSLATVGMIGFMMWLWIFNYKTLVKAVGVSDTVAVKTTDNMRYYANEYKVTKVALDETTIKLAEVTRELEETNIELMNTRGELSQVQTLNDSLKQNIQALERYKAAAAAKGEALEAMIDTFKKKNRKLDKDLQAVRKELAIYRPDIEDLAEGRSKVKLFKNHIQMVKRNMVALKRQAYEMHVAAQKEKDRLELLYGNNGYLVKDGQNTSMKAMQRKVDIDVQFVN